MKDRIHVFTIFDTQMYRCMCINNETMVPSKEDNVISLIYMTVRSTSVVTNTCIWTNMKVNKPLGGVRSRPLILQNPTGNIQGEVAW